MKLYDFRAGANCHRVTLYLAEKGLEIPRVPVDVFSLENRSPAFLRKNPAGKVPVLETDNGEFLAESAAIVEYLEELFPEPSMLGTTPLARAQTRRAERIASEVFMLWSTYTSHTHPFFRNRPGRPVEQVEVIARSAELQLWPLLELLERELAARPYLRGEAPGVADCTLFAGASFAKRFGYIISPDLPGLAHWFERFSARDSAKVIAASVPKLP